MDLFQYSELLGAVQFFTTISPAHSITRRFYSFNTNWRTRTNMGNIFMLFIFIVASVIGVITAVKYRE